MPKLKRLSGDEVIAIFARYGFVFERQKGSHVKLRRNVSGNNQNLTVPRHSEMDTGTLKAIIRQASRYISQEILDKEFYSE